MTPAPAPRRRDFGPVPLAPDSTVIGPDSQPHTDACIRDAARWGFCNHTRLVASPAQVERQRRFDVSVLKTTTHREIGSLLGTAALTTFTVLLTNLTGWWALLLIALSGVGWLCVFLFGLPSFLTADLSKALPPDTRARLDADLAEGRRRRALSRAHRAAHSKRKGPFGRG